uniref:protein-serine/threonine phosphatase n=3 Tax=Hirondellea gigas TaxID=1518452 RepID=A0A2P2I2P8_9CRUS
MAKCADDRKEEAEKYKFTANEHFKNQRYNLAIEFYSKAIENYPDEAIYHGNRSFAYLRTECFGYALTDATKAIELDKNYVKGYYRRASAYMSLGKYKMAVKDYENVVRVRPFDKDAKLKMTECQKVVQMLLFQKAIAVDDKKSVADSINLDAMTIEDNYNGPALEDGKVTEKFVVELMEHYKEERKLHKKYAYKILLDIKVYFEQQPTLVDVSIPDDSKFTVCGDIHGQFYDLMNIFKLNGLPSTSNPYLFNGDFVDRGSFSIECIFTLFSFKLLYPDHFFMSRGNHESVTMNQMYGFEGEVRSKYTSQMGDLFTEVYNWLPLCHCLNNKVLVMHGGLFSEDSVSLDDIRKTQRNRQPPEEGIMCELLWSDPMPGTGRAVSKRGVGLQFGADITKKFLDFNNLDYIIRSHEVKDAGYEVAHAGLCITVFSAPNYCDTMGNKGAFITLRGDTMEPKYVVYAAVEHPPVKPMAYASSPLLRLFS